MSPSLTSAAECCVHRTNVQLFWLIVVVLSIAVPAIAYAQRKSPESIAADIARQHNQKASSMLDDMIVSSSAEAVGRNVRFKYVLRVKKSLSQQQLTEYRAGVDQEVVIPACKANLGNDAFERGLYYTMIYHNTYGEKLAEMVVDKRVCASLLAAPTPTDRTQIPAGNSNLWPVHHDAKKQFRISYPPGWVIVPTKGVNVRFSVNPPTGAGNCNVVARPKAELAGMTQAALNREIESLPMDQGSWAEYIGLSPSQVRFIESRRARIHDVPAILGIVETTLENLEGKFTRKQILAMTFTPGVVWSLNCGASTFKADDARSRFSELQPTFNKVFGSFAFLR